MEGQMTKSDEILKLEREFWTTMTAGEHEKSAALIASQSAMVSNMGVMTFTPEDYVKMARSSPFAIKSWTMSDEKVIFPTADSALCSYKVKQTVKHDGKTETTTNHDTTVWVRDGSDWKCVLHSEMPVSEDRRSA
jgi:hypothetical protein